MARMTEILAALKLDARQFDAALKGSDAAMSQFAARAQKSGGAVNGVFGQLMASASRMPGVLKAGFAATAILGITRATQAAAALADEYDQLAGSIRNVSESETQAVRAMTAVQAIGDRTRQGLTATASLYTSVAIAAREAGKSQEESLRFTEAAQRAIALSRTGASQQQAAVLQLGQALASNTLQGDEFRSLRESAPRLIRAIADGLHVTTGELKALSKEGKLTADVIFNALISQTGKLAGEMGNLRRTQTQATQVVKDEWMKLAADNSIVNAFRSLAVKVADAIAGGLRKLNDDENFKLFAPLSSEGELPVRAMRNLLERGYGVGMAGDGPGTGLAFIRQGQLQREIARLRDAEATRDTRYAFNPAAGSAPAIFGMGASTLAPGARPSFVAPIHSFGTGPIPTDQPSVSDHIKDEKDKRDRATREAKRIADEAQRRKEEADRVLAEAKKLADDLEREVLRASGAIADALQAELRQWIEGMNQLKAEGKAVPDALVQRLTILKQQAVDAQRAIEASQPAMDAAERFLSDTTSTPSGSLGADKLGGRSGTSDRAGQIAALQGALSVQLQSVEAAKGEMQSREGSLRNVAAIKQLEDEILAIKQRQVALDDAKAEPEKLRAVQGILKESRTHVERIAAGIYNAVDGAVALADTFGAVSTEMRRTVTSLSLIGRGVSELKKARENATKENPLTSGQVFTSFLPILSGLVSVVGGLGDAFDAREAAQAKNTQALRDLSMRIGDLASSSIAGGTLSKIRDVVSDPQRFLNSLRGNTRIADQPAEIARQAGVALSDVTSILQTLGIAFDRDAGAIVRFSEALKAADLKAYTDTTSGALQRFQDSLTADGITDPLDVLSRRIAALTAGETGFPALASALEGLDIGSVDGRASALDRVRSLFGQLQAGTIPLAGLGGFSITDARQQLLELITSLRDSTAGGTTGTGGFNESRTITEVTGSRLAGLLGTGNTLLGEIVKNTAALRVGALPALLPPSLPAPGAAAGGTSITFSGLTISVTVPLAAGVSPAAGTAFGEAIGSATIDSLVRQLAPRLDAALGQRTAERRLLRGDARVAS